MRKYNSLKSKDSKLMRDKKVILSSYTKYLNIIKDKNRTNRYR